MDGSFNIALSNMPRSAASMSDSPVSIFAARSCFRAVTLTVFFRLVPRLLISQSDVPPTISVSAIEAPKLPKSFLPIVICDAIAALLLFSSKSVLHQRVQPMHFLCAQYPVDIQQDL